VSPSIDRSALLLLSLVAVGTSEEPPDGGTALSREQRTAAWLDGKHKAFMAVNALIAEKRHQVPSVGHLVFRRPAFTVTSAVVRSRRPAANGASAPKRGSTGAASSPAGSATSSGTVKAEAPAVDIDSDSEGGDSQSDADNSEEDTDPNVVDTRIASVLHVEDVDPRAGMDVATLAAIVSPADAQALREQGIDVPDELHHASGVELCADDSASADVAGHDDAAYESASTDEDSALPVLIADGTGESDDASAIPKGMLIVRWVSGKPELMWISTAVAIESGGRKVSADRAVRIMQIAKDAHMARKDIDLSGRGGSIVTCGSKVAVLFDEMPYYGEIVRMGFLKPKTKTLVDFGGEVNLDYKPDGLVVYCAWFAEAPKAQQRLSFNSLRRTPLCPCQSTR